MPADVLAAVREKYPPPWVVGWNVYEDTVQIEVSLRVAYAHHRHKRFTGATWAEALEAMR